LNYFFLQNFMRWIKIVLPQDTAATYLVKVAAKMIAQVRAQSCETALVIWDLVATAIFLLP
jgi:hypothetical protein